MVRARRFGQGVGLRRRGLSMGNRSRMVTAGVAVFAVVSVIDDARRPLAAATTWQETVGVSAIVVLWCAVVITACLRRGVWACTASCLALMVVGLVDGWLVYPSFGVAVATFAAAARGRRGPVAVVGVASVAWAYGCGISKGDVAVFMWGVPVMFALPAVFGGLVYTLLVRSARAEEHAHRVEEAAAAARERERALLAQELHDVVAHELTVIAMQATVLRYTDDEDAREQARSAIEHTSREALEELRRLLGVLRTSEVAASGEQPVLLAEDRLPEVAVRIDEELTRLGHPVTCRVAPVSVPRSAELAACRVLREAATNVVKHAGAGAAVRIVVDRVGDDLVVEVVNDVRGPAEAGLGSSRMGLTGLQERLRLLGGRFAAQPSGGGWQVEAAIPVQAPARAAELG